MGSYGPGPAPYTPGGLASYGPAGYAAGPTYGSAYAAAPPMYSSGYGAAPAYGYPGGDAIYSTTPASPALGLFLPLAYLDMSQAVICALDLTRTLSP